MIKIKLAVWVLLGFLTSGYVHSVTPEKNTQPAQRVASVVPIIHALNQALLNGTDLQAVYLPPKRLPVTRISHWVQHKSGPVITQLGPVTALVTIESIWPDLALYKHLRATNVRVIEIDAAQEILPGGAQVRLSKSDMTNHTYFWLAPDNLRVMSQIVARELQRVWPQHAANIRQNQALLQQQIGDYVLKLDQLLLDYDVMAVCIDNQKLMPLAQATYLPVEQTDCEGTLSIEKQIKKQAKQQDKSSKQKRVWMVDTGIKPLKKGLAVWLQNNLTNLEHALLH